MIREALDTLALAATSLVADLAQVTVTTHASEVRPALLADQTVVWVTPPSRVAFTAPLAVEVTWQVLILSPNHTDPIDGLDDLDRVLAVLEEPLGITSAEVDTIQLGQGPYFPALNATLNQTLRKD